MSYEILNKEILYNKEKSKKRNRYDLKDFTKPRRKKSKKFKEKLKITFIILVGIIFMSLCFWTYTTFLQKTNNIEIKGGLVEFEKNISINKLIMTSSDTNIDAKEKKAHTNKEIEIENFTGKILFENGFLVVKGEVKQIEFNKEKLNDIEIEIYTSEDSKIEMEVDKIDFEIKNPISKIGKTKITSKEKTNFIFENASINLIIENQNKKMKIFSDTENIKQKTKTIDLTYKKYDE